MQNTLSFIFLVLHKHYLFVLITLPAWCPEHSSYGLKSPLPPPSTINNGWMEQHIVLSFMINTNHLNDEEKRRYTQIPSTEFHLSGILQVPQVGWAKIPNRLVRQDKRWSKVYCILAAKIIMCCKKLKEGIIILPDLPQYSEESL